MHQHNVVVLRLQDEGPAVVKLLISVIEFKTFSVYNCLMLLTVLSVGMKTVKRVENLKT